MKYVQNSGGESIRKQKFGRIRWRLEGNIKFCIQKIRYEDCNLFGIGFNDAL
jgi:hypothetical protein